MKFIFPEKTGKSDKIKLILEITRNNLFKSKKVRKKPQKSLRISCQSVLISRKISGTFCAKLAKNTWNFKKTKINLKENNEKLEGKIQGIFYSGNILKFFYVLF